ncbi:MAG TPA: PQQ-dependent sugar dehydrogenase [Polyangiaceae bacterium]
MNPVCLAAISIATGTVACGDDDEDREQDDGRAGSSHAGQPTTGGQGTGEGGAGSHVDVDVFRPEERPFDESLLNALSVADGFELNVFGTDLGHARMLATHGEHVYLSRPMQGDVLRLTDENADGVLDSRTSVASELKGVHGIAFHDSQVFLATPTEVHRGTVEADGTFSGLTLIMDDLPDGGQHPNRTLSVGPDSRLYISVGSSCDACPETNPEHATLLRSTLDGTSRSIFASGLRNTIGFGWHPETEELWGFDHGSDWRGNDLPPEELNRIESGNDYGWPYCYGNRAADPVIQDPPDATKEAYCAGTTPPVLTYQAHSAPIGMVFYDSDGFPEEYRGDAFVALRGSWNRYPPTGYAIARLRFESGTPVGLEDFVTGFLIDAGRAQFGRLAGVTIAPDGALLFSDDANGVIYRVSVPATTP